MPKPRTRERKIKFYELRTTKHTDDADTANTWFVESNRPLNVVEEYQRLAAFSREKGPEDPDQGTTILSRSAYTLHGDVHWDDGRGVNLIVLSKTRPGEGGIYIQNTATGTRRLVPMTGEEGIAEESHVALLSRNVVAVIENGRSAPGRGDIEGYLKNKLGIMGAKLDPLVPPDRRAALSGGSVQFVKVEARLPAEAGRLDAAEEQRARNLLRRWRRETTEEIGEHVRLDVTLTATQEATRDEKHALKSLTTTIMDEETAERLKIDYRDVEAAVEDTVNLLDDIITMKATVTLEDVGGDDDEVLVFRPESTSRRIREAYDHLRNDLMAASGASDDLEPFRRRRWVHTEGEAASDGETDERGEE